MLCTSLFPRAAGDSSKPPVMITTAMPMRRAIKQEGPRDNGRSLHLNHFVIPVMLCGFTYLHHLIKTVCQTYFVASPPRIGPASASCRHSKHLGTTNIRILTDIIEIEPILVAHHRTDMFNDISRLAVDALNGARSVPPAQISPPLSIDQRTTHLRAKGHCIVNERARVQRCN